MVTIYSNKLNISVSGSTSGLAINNYSITYSCTDAEIVASGVVTYKNKPLSYACVNIGFCSVFDFNNNQFTGFFISTDTKSDGSFVTSIPTATPPGGANCIVLMVAYSGEITGYVNKTAVVHQSVTIPKC